MEHPQEFTDDRWLVVKNPMVRRVLSIGSGVAPYLAWLLPLMDRLFTPKRDVVTPALMTLRTDVRSDLRKDLKQHVAMIQAAQIDITPAIEEQQRRLEKLEEHTAELNHTLTVLSDEQLDLADQVKAMAGWVRNGAMGGLFLLTLLFILKLVQAIHAMGH
jgi:hypothetical protein